MRECFTQAAWNMWPYLYDQVLLPTHMWWLNGGSEAYFGYLYLWLDWHLLTAYFSRSYLTKQLAANAGMYEKPLENPEMSLDESFKSFVTQCLDAIDIK